MKQTYVAVAAFFALIFSALTTPASAQVTLDQLAKQSVGPLVRYVSKQPGNQVTVKYRSAVFEVKVTPKGASSAGEIYLVLKLNDTELQLWDAGLTGKASRVEVARSPERWSEFQKKAFGGQSYQNAIACVVALKVQAQQDCIMPGLYD